MMDSIIQQKCACFSVAVNMDGSHNAGTTSSSERGLGRGPGGTEDWLEDAGWTVKTEFVCHYLI